MSAAARSGAGRTGRRSRRPQQPIPPGSAGRRRPRHLKPFRRPRDRPAVLHDATGQPKPDGLGQGRITVDQEGPPAVRVSAWRLSHRTRRSLPTSTPTTHHDLHQPVRAVHLIGHYGSRPARGGDAALQRKQLDVLGEVLDAAHLFHDAVEEFTSAMSDLLVALVDRTADAGAIWTLGRGRPVTSSVTTPPRR